MDPGSCPLLILLQDSPSYLNPSFSFSIEFIIESIVLVSLLLFSGFFSGAETAFFAINPAQLYSSKIQPAVHRGLYSDFWKTKKTSGDIANHSKFYQYSHCRDFIPDDIANL